MAEPAPNHRLLAWGLASFHTGFFVLSLVLFLYHRLDLGELLANLNTLVGFAVFGALWLATWWSTSRALHGVQWERLDFPAGFGKVLTLGLFWGGANGLLFLLTLILGGWLYLLVSVLSGATTADALIGVLAFGIIGSLVAAVLGALSGLVFALLDSLLLAISSSILEGYLKSE